MTNAMPALLALLLVLSLPAMTVVAAQQSPAEEQFENEVDERYDAVLAQLNEPTTVQETTNRLELTGEIRNETIDYGPDLGTKLATTDDEFRNGFDQYVLFDREFDDAIGDERDEVINSTSEHIQERTAELEQRERDAVRAHAEGDISDTQLLQTLVRNHNEASTLSETIDEILDRSDDALGYSVDSNVSKVLEADQERLEAQQGSVRTLAGASQQGVGAGTTGGQTIAIETSNTGYRLQTIVGDTYVVETTRFDNRDIEGWDEFDDQGDAFDRFEELYPWAMEDGTTSFSGHNQDPANIYHAEISHSQGVLTSSLDSNSGEIYHEVQELDADSLPVSETTTETEDGLVITRNETPSNGPAEVTVTDAESGEPIESATISIDGVEVGETDDEGSVWIMPPDEEYDLRAESDAGTVAIEQGI